MDKQLKQILAGVAVIIVAAWLSWVSMGFVSVDKRVSVLESVITYLKDDLSEMKSIMKDVRNDQIRRQNMEAKR